MGILDKILGKPTPTEVVRADIFMDYRSVIGSGIAAVDWVPLNKNYNPSLRTALLGLLYTRILVAHAETRTKLFETFDEISKQNVRDEGQTGFKFPQWSFRPKTVKVEQKIWPWKIYSSTSLITKPKIYSAKLLVFQQSPTELYFGIDLKMAYGQERILAPASVMLAITSFVESTDQVDCYELALIIWQINEYYGSPNNIRIGSESKAYAAATAAIRNGDLRAP